AEARVRFRVRQQLRDLDQGARISARDEAHRAARANVGRRIGGAAIGRFQLPASQSAEKELDVVAIELDERSSNRLLREAARVLLRSAGDKAGKGCDQGGHEVVEQRSRRQRRGFRNDPAMPILESDTETARLLRPIARGNLVERFELFLYRLAPL